MPVTSEQFFASNSAAKAWWADAGADATIMSKKRAMPIVDFITNPPRATGLRLAYAVCVVNPPVLSEEPPSYRRRSVPSCAVRRALRDFLRPPDRVPHRNVR